MPCSLRVQGGQLFPTYQSPNSLPRLQVRADLAASFQVTAIRHLEERTARAVAWAQDSCPGIRCAWTPHRTQHGWRLIPRLPRRFRS